MLIPDSKLYVQLQPDATGLAALQTIQQALPAEPASRLVSASAMHLTVLHIGAVDRIIQSLQAVSAVPLATILRQADQLANDLQQTTTAHTGQPYALCPTGYQQFGDHHNTKVITFTSQPVLDDLHATCLQILQRFFSNCGVKNVTSFMTDDHNFQYALTLRPHLTLVKNYYGAASPTLPPTIDFHLMPIIY